MTAKQEKDFKSLIGSDNHNLRANHVHHTEAGIMLIFASKKTSKDHRECFLKWTDMPGIEAQKVLQEYEQVRPKGAPFYLSCRQGHPLDRNTVQEFIDLCTLHTDWADLKISSHCYRIGGGASHKFLHSQQILDIQW